MPRGTWGRETGLAEAYLGLADTTRALDAIERAAATDGDLFHAFCWNVPARLAALRDSPRRLAVMKRYKLGPERLYVQHRP